MGSIWLASSSRLARLSSQMKPECLSSQMKLKGPLFKPRAYHTDRIGNLKVRVKKKIVFSTSRIFLYPLLCKENAKIWFFFTSWYWAICELYYILVAVAIGMGIDRNMLESLQLTMFDMAKQVRLSTHTNKIVVTIMIVPPFSRRGVQN